MLPAAVWSEILPTLLWSSYAPTCGPSSSRAHLTIGAMRRTINRRGFGSGSLHRCGARTDCRCAWRRQVVNEELNWGTSNASCCISSTKRVGTPHPCDVSRLGVFFTKDWSTHTLKNKRAANVNVECAASDALPPAMPAPKKSPQKWINYGGRGGWRPDEFNERTGSTILGHCSRTDNLCGGCGDDLWAAPLAERKARATAARLSSLGAATLPIG